MKLLTALGLTAALLLSAQPAAALNAPTLRSKSVCLAELKAANKAKRAPQLKNCRFGAITLKNANFRNADLRGADFTSYKTMNGATFPIKGSTLNGADFRGANLSGTIFVLATLGGSNFTNLDLRNTHFTFRGLNRSGDKICFSGSNECHSARFYSSAYQGDCGANILIRTKLDGVDLSGTELKSVSFGCADLTGADLRDTGLSQSNFGWANLTNANFSGATRVTGGFESANLTNANFSGLIGSPYFHPVYPNFDGALWSNTTMPDGRICSLESSQPIDRFSCPSE